MPTTFYPLLSTTETGEYSQIAYQFNAGSANYNHHFSYFKPAPKETTATIIANTNDGAGQPLYVTSTARTSGWMSKPLNGFSLTGNVTFRLWASESNNTANATIEVNLWKATSINSFIGSTSINAELTTSQAGYFITIAPNPTTFLTGDRLFITYSMIAAPGLTLGANRTVSLVLNSPTAGVSGDTFVTFTENITLSDQVRFVSSTG